MTRIRLNTKTEQNYLATDGPVDTIFWFPCSNEDLFFKQKRANHKLQGVTLNNLGVLRQYHYLKNLLSARFLQILIGFANHVTC